MSFGDLSALFLGEFLVFVMGLIVIVLWMEGERRLAVKTILVVILTFGLIQLLKKLIPTPRPFEVHEIAPLTIVFLNESFPSAHAGVAFAMASSVWLAKHRLGAVMLVLAVLVGIGRVLLWVHFPIDVIIGGLIGAITAFVLSEVFQTRK